MVANRLPVLDEVRNLDEEMSELSLLLPTWQAKALQDAARVQGISAGQYLRRLLDDSLPRPEASGSYRWVDFG